MSFEGITPLYGADPLPGLVKGEGQNSGDRLLRSLLRLRSAITKDPYSLFDILRVEISLPAGIKDKSCW